MKQVRNWHLASNVRKHGFASHQLNLMCFSVPASPEGRKRQPWRWRWMGLVPACLRRSVSRWAVWTFPLPFLLSLSLGRSPAGACMLSRVGDDWHKRSVSAAAGWDMLCLRLCARVTWTPSDLQTQLQALYTFTESVSPRTPSTFSLRLGSFCSLPLTARVTRLLRSSP